MMNAIDLRTQRQTIDVYRGRSFKWTYAITDDDDEPTDVSSWVIVSAFKRVGSDVPAAEVTLDRTDDENGKGTLEIVGFSELPIGSYSLFVRYTDSLAASDYACVASIRIHEVAP
jgi:hypothetical protein